MSADIRSGAARRKKILVLENSLHVTGAFMSALVLADSLRDYYEIEFVMPSQSTLISVVESKGILCHSLRMIELGRSWWKLVLYFPYLILNVLKLRRILLTQKITVLIVNDYYNLLGAAIKITGWHGRLLTIVRLLPFSQNRLLNRIWSNAALLFSEHVIAVSRVVQSQLPDSKKIDVIYDPARFEERYSKGLDKCCQVKGVVVCLYLANYIFGKGHQYALEAFSAAYSLDKTLRLQFVGGDMGLEKNKQYRDSLLRRSEELNLGDVVTFEGFSSDVERTIKKSDMVLNFSNSESFSYTCLEACAFGRPVIATRCGGPEEIVVHELSGLLVPVGDVSAMTAAILLLAGDPVKREIMGMAGRRVVREKFSNENFVNFFRKMCE
jgi:glycosyltransferase involved in cell wall biosynthesis